MREPWQRILSWVESHARELRVFLEPGADAGELGEAERRLSMRLPTVLREFYGLQNGTSLFAVFPALESQQTAFGPLPLDEIEFVEEDEDAPARRARRRRKRAAEDAFEADPGVRPEFWNRNWIPFAAASDRGDYLMVDFAPTRAGRPGQVVEWRHETNERRLVATSLTHLMDRTAADMEAGRIVYDRERGVRRV